ncbi:MAG: hypothetical protein VYD11_07355 [Actinomycetota bacterium]|nr:hypothetical protein [Actinomycetota bacterium]MED5232008.1 hypothetical protein [Actinomycetota bacterium]MED5394516.1 hypothetical protein [Actinomycetota bacterium]MEE3353351.1 hypothetical protein [Actinomycetota bacterium]
MTADWRNPFLADSENPIAHGRCDQQDSTVIDGPLPTGGSDGQVLGEGDLQYTWLGPGHFGGLISGPYPDGQRTIWSQGRECIVKLDHDTFEVLARLDLSHERPDEPVSNRAEWEAGVAGLDLVPGPEDDPNTPVLHAAELAGRFLTGLDGVYALLDHEHTLYLGRKSGAVAYSETDPSDRYSPLVEKARWDKPPEVEGSFVGVNMTPDGRLVLSTDHGWLVSLARDFSNHVAAQLPGAVEQAAMHCDRMEAERGNTAYGWIRTSICCDDAGGIYVSSVDHTHKVVWTGDRFSFNEADGAWSAEYRNGTGVGSGTTPCLMGFGPDEDRFVVIGDGDDVVNITLLWRDEIPDDWEQLSGAPSRRIAGLGPANMGDPDLAAIQTEQSITVAGSGAMTVNNEPGSRPEWLPARGARLLCFFLGHHDRFTPYGMHKYEWNSETRTFDEAWVASGVSSPNSVPYVSQGSDTVYTCGTRRGKWTIEAVNWSTGQSRGHWVVGDSRFNTLGGGVNIDGDGRIVFGTIFGKTRILARPETRRPESASGSR